MASQITACQSQYFNDRLQIGYSISQITPVINGGTGNVTFKATRPFIPIVAVDVSFSMLSMINNQAVSGMYYNLMENALNASVNNAQSPASFPKINDGLPEGTYSQYLYKKTGSNTATGNQIRYLAQAGLITNFWANIDLGNTGQEYYNEISALMQRVREQYDAGLFTAPGDYEFAVGDSFAIDWTALLALDATLAGLLCIELVSI